MKTYNSYAPTGTVTVFVIDNEVSVAPNSVLSLFKKDVSFTLRFHYTCAVISFKYSCMCFFCKVSAKVAEIILQNNLLYDLSVQCFLEQAGPGPT